MEKRDLYDINKNLTGETICKGQVVSDNRYILVVLVFMQNSKGEFLIQKRSIQKDGKYGSTGGHAKMGESSIEAIITEVKEEINLEVSSEELQLVFSGREDSDRVFFDIYYLKKDFNIENMTLQKDEVESVKWCTINEIEELIDKGLFLNRHAEEFHRMIEILEI